MVDSLAVVLPLKAYPADALEISGVLIPPDPKVITPPILAAIRAGRFERQEAQQIPRIVEAGDRVLEIGAGIGFISTLLSREKRVASVVAVEANPNLMDYMASLHRLNRVGKVSRINAVLSNETGAGVSTFYLRRDFWMGSLMAGPNPFIGEVEVPTRNFSALLRDEAISLIVCDVEGAETFLFEGADLAGVDRVFLELHDHVTGLRGVASVFATFTGKGFAYDPRHSEGGVVLFRRIRTPDVPRPYRL